MELEKKKVEAITISKYDGLMSALKISMTKAYELKVIEEAEAKIKLQNELNMKHKVELDKANELYIKI